MITYFSPTASPMVDENNNNLNNHSRTRRGSLSSIASKRSFEQSAAIRHQQDPLNDSGVNITMRRSKSRGLSQSSSLTNTSMNRSTNIIRNNNGKSSSFLGSNKKKSPFSLRKPSDTSFLSPDNNTTLDTTAMISRNKVFSPQFNENENISRKMPMHSPDPKRPRFGSIPSLAIHEDTDEEEAATHNFQKQQVVAEEEEQEQEESDMEISTPEPSPKPIIINPKAIKAMKHPKSIPRPPKQVIKSFFTSALASKSPRVRLSEDQMNDNSVKFETITTATTSISDQRYVAPAGLLSFDQVLLPAIGLMEEKLLKKVQAKVQRDSPEYKKAVEKSRLLVRKSVLAAIQAVEESRKQLYLQQEQNRRDLAIKRQIAREAQALLKEQARKRKKIEMQEQRKVQAAERKKQLQLEYPKNKALKEEVISLTLAITRLEKEEMRWTKIEESILRREQQQEPFEDEETPEEVVTIIRVEKHPLQEQTEQTMQDIVISSTRIQQGLSAVQNNILPESRTCQKQLYGIYQKDHMFHGYQGIQNKAGMIRFLSQE